MYIFNIATCDATLIIFNKQSLQGQVFETFATFFGNF